MHTNVLLFVVVLGTALTVVADRCISDCASAYSACWPGDNYIGCICKDKDYSKTLKKCLKKCNAKKVAKAEESSEKRCDIYAQSEDYPGQNCVKACEADWLPDTKCDSGQDWDCLCKSSQYLDDMQSCLSAASCSSGAVSKWMKKKDKKCGHSSGSGGKDKKPKEGHALLEHRAF
ncbi:hypothetical protein Moror_12152 [Moniliophthora roreri MCA 2997]|uniref:CFEM domain-containing protein n=1 Tax=Moniliophthora roreri (strain MCA 2997) TaxID=1381753 RepID=V2W6I6_MONRO|nr:hypothetical protein Moror_12152 [Moniliophthora roreri MCA 2997]